VEDLLKKIRLRLAQGAFTNEAAVSISILMPILQALGWDVAEPDQVIPEYSSGRGRVDFALCTSARRPAVFIEVKGVGRSLEGDRQLFEYAFHEGVPLCVLTDGREWSFYLPGGQGSYDERRVYRLQLDERGSEECERVLTRYLARERVKSGAALEAATADYRNVSASREASRVLPRAWAALVAGPEDLLIELLSDQVESICGFRPEQAKVIRYLQGMGKSENVLTGHVSLAENTVPTKLNSGAGPSRSGATSGPRAVTYKIFGEERGAGTANSALVDVLSAISKGKEDLLPKLAAAVQGNTRNHIARTVQEIYPARPDLARAVEFTPGWLIGLNIANREKVQIVKKACETFGLQMGKDVEIRLPNT
jgi:hypothetical protein